MKRYDYKGTEVTVTKDTYWDGTVALVMNTADGEQFAVATVNLLHPRQSESSAFLDENNLPGIGEWIERNGLGKRTGVTAVSGFCRYPLYQLF